MARLWTSGFELNSATSGVEWSTVAGSPTIASATKRTGSYSGRITSLSSGASKSFRQQLAAATSVMFVRVYFRYHTLPSASNSIIDFNSTGTMRVRVKLNTDGTLELSDEDGVIGSSTTAITADTFTRVEIKLDASAAGGSHIVELKIEGTVEATASNRNISTTVNQLTIGGNLATEAQTVGDWYFDDVAINDNTGTAQTGYPGAGSAIHLHPNGQDDVTGSHGSPFGFSGDTQEYLCVDDPDTPDEDTTYIIFSGGTGVQYYPLTDTPSDLDANATINVVQAGWRTRASAASLSNVMVLQLRQSGTNTSTGNTTTSVASYRTNNFGSTTDTSYPITRYTNAGNGNAAFTKADLDSNVMLGLQRGASNSNNPRITDIWVIVEYVPSPPVVVRSFAALGVG